jgi:hypothetical protein
MTPQARALLGAAVILMALVALPRPASACSCFLAEGYGVDHWDIVFEGTATRVGVREEIALTRFRVEQFWKGHLGEFLDVEHPFDGTLLGNCGVHFDPGETYRLGVARRTDTCNGSTALCALLGQGIDWEAIGSGVPAGSGAGPLDADASVACAADGGSSENDAFLETWPWDGGLPSPEQSPPVSWHGGSDASVVRGSTPPPTGASIDEPSNDGAVPPPSASCSCRLGSGQTSSGAGFALGFAVALLGLRARCRVLLRVRPFRNRTRRAEG